MQKEMEALIKKANAPVKKGKKANGPKVFNQKDKNFKKDSRNQHLFNSKTGDAIAFKTGSYKPSDQAIKTSSLSPISLVLKNNQDFQLNLGNHLPDTGTMRVRILAGLSNGKKNEYASLRLLFGAHTSNNANFTVTAKNIPEIHRLLFYMVL